MFNEIFARLGKFSINELFCLRKGVDIIEARRVGHPKGIPCLTARYVDNGTTDGYLNLLNLVEHQQAKMPVEAIHVQGLIERGSWFENMIFLRCCQKRIEISTKSVITDVAEIVLRTCHILNVESTRLQQCHQLSW